MEKTLDILKDIRMVENEYDHHKQHRFDEAIAELEEAMKPKTCEGCKYVSQGRYRAPCDTCARTLHDEYEPKEQL